MPPKFRYTILYNGNEYTFSDPMGWDTLTTVLSRGDFHGVNAEMSQEISFPGEYHGFLRSVYERFGVYSNVNLRVDIRKIDWTYEQYGLFLLDFSSYQDDFSTITVTLVESSLRAKINANLNTEYQLDYGPGIVDAGLNYVGQRRMATNVVQYLVGERETITGGGYQILRGTRSLRTYTDAFSFTNPDGSPYESMKMRAVNPITFQLEVSVDLKVSTVGDPEMHLVRLNSSGGLDAILRTFTRTSVPFNNHFQWSGTQSVTLGAGQFVALVVRNFPSNPSLVTEAENTFFRVSTYTTSPHTGKRLQVFTFEYLIGSLLAKIDPDSTMVMSLPERAYRIVLSDPDSMRAIGSAPAGKIVTTLKDALDALDYLECIGVDVSGNTVTIRPRDQMYTSEGVTRVESTNLVLEHDNTHVYNTVKVSSKFDNTNKTGNVSLFGDKVFTTRKEGAFSPENGKELSLKCPYVIDPLVIDEMISKYAENYEQGDDTVSSDLVIFAVQPYTSTLPFTPKQLYRSQTVWGYIGDAGTIYNLPFSPKRIVLRHQRYIAVSMVGGDKTLVFESSKSAVNIVSRLGFESVDVEENRDEGLAGVDPYFLPTKAVFDTGGDPGAIQLIRGDRYGRVSTVYRGRTIEGFVSEVSSSVGKETVQSWGLLIKEIT